MEVTGLTYRPKNTAGRVTRVKMIRIKPRSNVHEALRRQDSKDSLPLCEVSISKIREIARVCPTIHSLTSSTSLAPTLTPLVPWHLVTNPPLRPPLLRRFLPQRLHDHHEP
jgi:hypothetical protein